MEEAGEHREIIFADVAIIPAKRWIR